MRAARPRFLVGRRVLTVAVGALIAAAASARLDLSASDLRPGRGGVALLRDFLAHALGPALHHEGGFVPPGSPPLLVVSLAAAGRTVFFAAASLGLAVPCGLVLGVLCSRRFWHPVEEGAAAHGAAWRRLGHTASRALAAGLRALHELLWALLLLLAFGLTKSAALLAIALPYTGILAKVFSELLDEAPAGPLSHLSRLGAGRLQALLFGLFPAALPDLLAYLFYRLECALRSSAVLGFFGFATLGLEIRQAFRAGLWAEAWTHLWVLILLVVLFENWSGAVRRRLSS